MILCALLAMSGESGEQGEKAKDFRAKFGSTTRALDCGCRLCICSQSRTVYFEIITLTKVCRGVRKFILPLSTISPRPRTKCNDRATQSILPGRPVPSSPLLPYLALACIDASARVPAASRPRSQPSSRTRSASLSRNPCRSRSSSVCAACSLCF